MVFIVAGFVEFKKGFATIRPLFESLPISLRVSHPQIPSEFEDRQAGN